MQPWSIELKPWPYWNQNADPMPAGLPEDNAENDCGPESVAMVTKYITGVALPADYIKDDIYGEAYQGYTQVADLAQWLERKAEIRASVIGAQSMASLLWNEWRYLVRGKPLIGLFSFSAPGASDGHFRCVVGMTPSAVITADPWTGSRRVEGLAEHWVWSKGTLIAVERKRDSQL